MVANSLEPCLISLYKNTKDDYRLKYLNSQVTIEIKIGFTVASFEGSSSSSGSIQIAIKSNFID